MVWELMDFLAPEADMACTGKAVTCVESGGTGKTGNHRRLWDGYEEGERLTLEIRGLLRLKMFGGWSPRLYRKPATLFLLPRPILQHCPVDTTAVSVFTEAAVVN